jgi:ribosomal protein L9
MDLRIYYQKIREQRAAITEEFPIVVSKDTQDGGRQGTMTEVTRDLAARLLVDGTAKLASAEDAAAFRDRQKRDRKAAEDERAASRVQLTLVPKEFLEQVRKKG